MVKVVTFTLCIFCYNKKVCQYTENIILYSKLYVIETKGYISNANKVYFIVNQKTISAIKET